jgi:hypothetical protein
MRTRKLNIPFQLEKFPLGLQQNDCSARQAIVFPGSARVANSKAFLSLRNTMLFPIVMADAFCGSNLYFNVDNDVSHRSHDSPFSLLLGDRRPDLQNKGVTNRVELSVCVPELLGRGVLPPAFGNVHCCVDLHIHQDDQSVGIPLAAGILECSAEVPTSTRQAEILQHPVRDRFSPFIQPFLQRDSLILRLHYEFFGLLLAEGMLFSQNVLSQLFAIDDVPHLEGRSGNRLIENRF